MSGEKEAANKRAAARAAADFIIELYEPDGKTLVGIGRLLNLSASGACVESTCVLVEMLPIVIRLLVKKVNLLTLASEVMWVKVLPHSRQYGVKFKPYPMPAKAVIDKYVESYFAAQEKGVDFLDAPPES